MLTLAVVETAKSRRSGFGEQIVGELPCDGSTGFVGQRVLLPLEGTAEETDQGHGVHERGIMGMSNPSAIGFLTDDMSAIP